MRVFVRMIGTKVCMTRENGQFFFCEREEMTPDQLAVVDKGGGFVNLSPIMSILEWK